VTENRSPTADELNGVKQDTVQREKKAHRVFSVNDVLNPSSVMLMLKVV
jgi:hypothetical protein